MLILICNVGSTSLKYRLFEMEQGERELAWGRFERVGAPMGAYEHCDAAGGCQKGEGAIESYSHGIQQMLDYLISSGMLKSLADLACVGFKVVHAKGISGVQLLTEEVLSAMEAFNTVAPSHNPPYLAAIRQFAKRQMTWFRRDGEMRWLDMAANPLGEASGYIDAFLRDQTVSVTFKNISRDALNIPASELTERFVRGDTSRNSDGSGLGLSIAQSLAELQGAKFDVQISGDLFTAGITLPVSPFSQAAAGFTAGSTLPKP